MYHGNAWYYNYYLKQATHIESIPYDIRYRAIPEKL